MANPITFCRNKGLLVLLFLCWFAVNGFLFSWVFFTLRNDVRFHYMYMMLGDVIFLARGTGILLNFNCALVLLPMNRYINSWIRCHLLKNSKGTLRRLFDHSKGIHITIALTICLLSVVHTGLHLYNCFSFHHSFAAAVPQINLEDSKENTTLLKFCGTLPGLTGAAMMFILLLLSVSSFKVVRRIHHNLFGFLHYLSLFFVALMAFHGFGKVTKFQTNIQEHPIQCHSLSENIESPECTARPQFDYIRASSWKWLAFSLTIHVVDRLLRLWRRWKECEVVEMRLHECEVVELVFSKKCFRAKPGQYIWVQCAELSEFEWHAFTLTKCPSKVTFDQTFSVHIKVVGDWTMKLASLVRNLQEKDQMESKRVGNSCVVEIGQDKQNAVKPTFRIDGPYGSPHQDAFRFPVNISIAAGIGITPFLATIRDLKNYRKRTNQDTFKMKKMHLFWVCRSVKEFTWVLNEIHDIENELETFKVSDLLEVHLYVTREKKEEITGKLSGFDVNHNWLASKINYGRPDFKTEIEKAVAPHEKERIGLFYCGSQQLGKKIYENMKTLKKGNNILIYNKESFG